MNNKLDSLKFPLFFYDRKKNDEDNTNTKDAALNNFLLTEKRCILGARNSLFAHITNHIAQINLHLFVESSLRGKRKFSILWVFYSVFPIGNVGRYCATPKKLRSGSNSPH